MGERGRILSVKLVLLLMGMANVGVVWLMLHLANTKPGDELFFHVIATFHSVVAMGHMVAMLFAKHIAGDDAIPLLAMINANKGNFTVTDIDAIRKALDDLVVQNRDTSRNS